MQKVIDEKIPINDYIDNYLVRDDKDGFTDVDLFKPGSEEVFLPLPTDREIHEINDKDNRVDHDIPCNQGLQTISPQTLDSLMPEVNTTESQQPEAASTEILSTQTIKNINPHNLFIDSF